jgi:glycosyltransferase involved in cell wall biosynthesis
MRLVYVVNHVAFFVSHRLPIAEAMARDGHDVSLVTGQAGSNSMEDAAIEELKKSGVPHTRLSFGTGANKIAGEIRGFLALAQHFSKVRPDLVHCASPKALLYGGIAARLCQVPALVLSVSGMGYAYTDDGRRSLGRRILASTYGRAARVAFGHRNKRVIVQNSDDWNLLKAAGYTNEEELRLIHGSGVDLSLFPRIDYHQKKPIVVFPARILRDKGAVEFVEAARMLRTRAKGWRFLMAGAADYQNPSSISEQVVRAWHNDGVIEWLGHVDDMNSLLRYASIVCLPSYREGLPKALIEAAAAGCAVVTTDTVGCREAVIAGETGDLVPLRNSQALADALLGLMTDTQRRIRYGQAGVELSNSRFELSSVISQHKQIYREIYVQRERI